MGDSQGIIRFSSIWIVAFAAACSSAGPEKTAAQYEERRIAGDFPQITALLVSAEEAAVRSGNTSLDEVGLSSGGMLEAVVDSQRTLSTSGDTARVEVFLTAPNGEALVKSFFARAMSGQLPDTARAAMRKALASAPRVTVMDTVTLLKEDGNWRVRLGIAERKAVAAAMKVLSDAYIDDDLARAIDELTLIVEDANGKQRKVQVERLQPGEVEDVFEPFATLEPGKAKRVTVGWMKFEG